MKHLAPGLIKPPEIPMAPILELVQAPLDGIPSCRYANSTTQLGVISKFTEGALDPFICVVNDNTE